MLCEQIFAADLFIFIFVHSGIIGKSWTKSMRDNVAIRRRKPPTRRQQTLADTDQNRLSGDSLSPALAAKILKDNRKSKRHPNQTKKRAQTFLCWEGNQ
ncbi:hypothetical protein CEXT_64191 [Caerostris extrusa]|uniref:Uncharacterized protein n=1 Tax=Caerostris extrusa TaxID=172846 RepID=A0AAV4QA94_CAEEX|nr:hypothetical protein CEXT_64191 [Caerostris extrusa]